MIYMPVIGKHIRRIVAYCFLFFAIVAIGIAIFRINRSLISEVQVEGSSMEPLLHSGQTLRVATKNILPIHHGDIVIYDYTHAVRDDINPIVKRVVGLSGDTWTYSHGVVTVNGDILKNSEGVPYSVTSPILELYAKDYPTIPPGMLLIFGNIPGGSKDSSKFGFVAEKDIQGKVLK